MFSFGASRLKLSFLSVITNPVIRTRHRREGRNVDSHVPASPRVVTGSPFQAAPLWFTVFPIRYDSAQGHGSFNNARKKKEIRGAKGRWHCYGRCFFFRVAGENSGDRGCGAGKPAYPRVGAGNRPPRLSTSRGRRNDSTPERAPDSGRWNQPGRAGQCEATPD